MSTKSLTAMTMARARAFSSPFLVLYGLLFSVFLHKKLGMDSFWDTANYHVFIGWSAASLKAFEFGAVAQYHTYLNPVIDIVNYLAFSYHPYLGAFFHSVAYAFAIYLIVKILELFLPGTLQDRILLFLGVLISATGAMTISLFGSWTNENVIAIPILLGLYLLLRSLGTKCNSIFIFSGIAFGISVGLKLTSAHYVVGALFTLVICSRQFKSFILFGLGLLAGYLIVDGVFLYLRWETVGNPVFPFANNIFKSPYFPEAWKSFSSFDPSKIFYYLSLPFIWLQSGDLAEASAIRDGRLLLAYLGCGILVISFFKSRRFNEKELGLVAFFLFSFLSWILVFRIYRYLVGLEMISGVVLVVGLQRVFLGRKQLAAIVVAFSSLVFLAQVTNYPDWGRRQWGEKFASSNLVEIIKNKEQSVVFFADQRVAFLAPDLYEAGVRFGNLYSQPWWDGARASTVQDSDSSVDPVAINIQQFQDVYFLQYSRLDPRAHSTYLNKVFPSEFYDCVKITTNTPWNPHLCHLAPLAEVPMIDVGSEYNHDSGKIIFQDGWSSAESTRRWTDGNEASLFLRLPSVNACQPVIRLRGGTFGEQKLRVSVNDIQVFTGDVNGDFSLQLDLAEKFIPSESMRVVLSLPTARLPGNGDSRLLAIAFYTIAVDCKVNEPRS